MIRLFSFLGNPGKEYEMTRHNLPWLVADRLTERDSLSWQSKFRGVYAQIGHGALAVYLHKPLTFMNLSGLSVQEIKTFYRLSAQEILIIHDDVEMKEGETGVKFGGGLGGHNGLRSVASVLGTRDFYRLRIGVGRPERGSVSSYVLKMLSSGELDAIQTVITEAVSLIDKLIQNSSDIDEYLKR